MSAYTSIKGRLGSAPPRFRAGPCRQRGGRQGTGRTVLCESSRPGFRSAPGRGSLCHGAAVGGSAWYGGGWGGADARGLARLEECKLLHKLQALSQLLGPVCPQLAPPLREAGCCGRARAGRPSHGPRTAPSRFAGAAGCRPCRVRVAKRSRAGSSWPGGCPDAPAAGGCRARPSLAWAPGTRPGVALTMTLR